MVNAAVAECYATLVEGFNTLRVNGTRHRGADYRRAAGQPVVAYEKCIVVNSDFYSEVLGYCLVAKRVRDGRMIGWAHLRKGTRPANGTVLEPGDRVGLVAGWGENPGSAWFGPHIHTTEDDGADWTHIYQGQNSDPVPDITAAVKGTTPGTGGGVINYSWYEISPAAQLALQKLLNHRKIYGGIRGGTGPEDSKFGPNSVKGVQLLFKDLGLLPADYEIDGIPHNEDQNAPSNYGYAMQKFANRAGYAKAGGKEDGLPAGMTSEYVVKAANAMLAVTQPTPTPEPIPVPPVLVPIFPPAREGFVFFPDLGTSQSTFDFVEYRSKGGAWAALKMGGANASDSPYTAPAYRDQVSRALAQNIKLIHYWFNGAKNGLTPEACADYFHDNSRFAPGHVMAVDVEDEIIKGVVETKAWTPDEVVRYIKRARVHYPGVKGLVYASDSVLDNPEWQKVWDLGWEPWNASWGDNDGDPNTMPETSAPITVWQYTSKEKVPGNYRLVNGVKVYGETDGNLGRADLFTRLGWVVPTEPEPEPEPEVPGQTTAVLKDFLEEVGSLATELAKQL